MNGKRERSNGVKECWSDEGTRKGVLKHWSPGVPYPLCGTGPEAGVPGKSHGRCGKRPYHASGRVARCRKRRIGRRVEVGKGGREVGKAGKLSGFSHFATGFAHLFPDDSVQVVDFPHLACVRLFRESEDSPQRRRDAETSGAWNRHGEREMECRSFGVLGAKAAGKRQSRRAGGQRSGETPSILVAITGTSRSLKFT